MVPIYQYPLFILVFENKKFSQKQEIEFFLFFNSPPKLRQWSPNGTPVEPSLLYSDTRSINAHKIGFT